MPTEDEKEIEENECVKVIGNEILFYADVDRETLLTSLKNLRSWRLNFLKRKLNSLGTNP